MLINTAKKTFTLLCSLMLALVFVGTSCKKDEVKTSQDLIAAHSWKMTGYTIAGISDLDDCEKDDIYTFDKDGEFQFDEGATKCFESDFQQLTGNWAISTSTSPETLTITYDSGSKPIDESKITELIEDRMVLTVEFTLGGVTTTEVRTFEKI